MKVSGVILMALNTSKLNRIQKQLEIKLRQLKSGSNTDSAELNKILLTIEALQAISADPSLVDGKVSGINNKFLNMLRQEQLKLKTEILKGDPNLDTVLSSYMRIKSLLRLTTDRSLYNTRVNENNNKVNITRPAWPTSEFAQDLTAMYGHLMKPGKEDKESYEEAKEYLKEDVDMKYVLEGNLFDNIRAKQERIAKGSGEKMKKPNQKGYPKHLEKIAKEAALNERLFKAEFVVETNGRKRGVVNAENEEEALTKVIKKFNVDAENIKKLNEDFSSFLIEDINDDEKVILERYILQEEQKQKSSFLFFLLKFIPERRLNKLIQDIYNSASSKLSEPSEKEKLKNMLNIDGKNKKEKIALIRNLLNQAPESELSKAGEKSINFIKSKVKNKVPAEQISEDVLNEEITPQEKQEQIQSLQRNAGMISSLVGVSPIILMHTTALGAILGVYLFLIPVIFSIIMSSVMPKLIENIKKK
jgi:hypothetical protein